MKNFKLLNKDNGLRPVVECCVVEGECLDDVKLHTTCGEVFDLINDIASLVSFLESKGVKWSMVYSATVPGMDMLTALRCEQVYSSNMEEEYQDRLLVVAV